MVTSAVESGYRYTPLPGAGGPIALAAMPAGTLGRESYGHRATVHRFTVSGGLRIGNYCSIAADVDFLLGGNHRHDWVTTFPFSPRFERFKHLEPSAATKGDILIGNDVWIGQGAMVLSGVTIGDGAVIGARAVVGRNVEPYAIVTGNPGKFVRHRCPPEQVTALRRIAWWDWPEERIERAVPMLMQGDIAAFIAAVDAGDL